MDEHSAAEAPRTGVVDDNSMGRLLALSDGIFAIAMTLLALDLVVPDVGSHPSDSTLRHALADRADSYWSFLLTFYVVSGYWSRHRRLLRTVTIWHRVLNRDTLILLLLVAAMPFPASLLGHYGGEPIALAVYGAVNVAATLVLMVTSWDVRRLGLASGPTPEDDYFWHRSSSWMSLVVFALSIPAVYVVGRKGLYILVLLAIPDRIAWIKRLRARRSRR